MIDSKYILFAIKNIPFIVSVWILLMLTGIISDTLYPIFGQSVMFNALLYLLSIKYKFCTWHRAMIINNTFCVSLELLEVNNIVAFRFVDNVDLAIITINLFIFAIYGTRKRM